MDNGIQKGISSFLDGIPPNKKDEPSSSDLWLPAPYNVVVKPTESTYGSGYESAMQHYENLMNQVNEARLQYNTPQFKLDTSSNKVVVTGLSDRLDSPAFQDIANIISDSFAGADLSDPGIANALQATLDKANEQLAANAKHEQYMNFLDSKGFSDAAYRNYVSAKQTSENTNVPSSSALITGYDKNGNQQTWSVAKWFEYWKKEYSSEERAKLWLDSQNSYYKALVNGGDEELYNAMPYILMGSKESVNAVQGALNAINPFDGGEGWSDAKVNVPIYGFDSGEDVKALLSAFGGEWQKAGAGLLQKFAITPWESFGQYKQTGQQVFGKDFDEEKHMPSLSEEEFQRYLDLWNSDKKGSAKSRQKKLAESVGEDEAMIARVVGTFDKKSEDGYAYYTNFRDEILPQSAAMQLFENLNTIKQGVDESNLVRSVYAPNMVSLGVLTGDLSRFAAEQLALSAISGGTLSAENIVKTLTGKGFTLAEGALNSTRLGQAILSKSPAAANLIHAAAVGSAEGLTKASTIIYTAGKIGTKLIAELGEDAITGIVDDVITGNSLDSQGNLDPTKFAENIWMNAVVLAATKGAGKALSTIGDIANKTRNIDGVSITGTKSSQLSKLDDAIRKQKNTKISHIDNNGHPVIKVDGKEVTLDNVTLSNETVKAMANEGLVKSPTKTYEEFVSDTSITSELKDEISKAIAENDINKVKKLIEDNLSDEEIRDKFADGKIKIGDRTIDIDTREFTAADISNIDGGSISNLEEAIANLESIKKGTGLKIAMNSIAALRKFAGEFADTWKEAVDSYAQSHNITSENVMLQLKQAAQALRNGETIPDTLPKDLIDLWNNTWKPVSDRLIEIERKMTGNRVRNIDFYSRDMIKGSFKPGESGSFSIDEDVNLAALGADASPFDITASSLAKNTGKLSESQLELDPYTLAYEYIVSRSANMAKSGEGRYFSAMKEAARDGEFEFTEADARRQVGAIEEAANEVDSTEVVKEMVNDAEHVPAVEDVKFSEEELSSESTKKTINQNADARKNDAVDFQRKFDDAAKKSNAAEIISNNSQYKKRGVRAQAEGIEGVNYLPSNPFGKLSSWVNDRFVKANSIRLKGEGFDTTVYKAGYSLYAEAGTYARRVIIDIKNGMNITDAVYGVLRDSGFFIEPSKYAQDKFGALSADEQALDAANKIVKRIQEGKYAEDILGENSTIKDTNALAMQLTYEFKRRGSSDFMKFLKKSDFNTFTKGEQKWLNQTMYAIAVDNNKKLRGNVSKMLGKISQTLMGARYRANMYFNFKNAQLQLTEIQRLFTMNKLGDFADTVTRLIKEPEFRSRVTDAAYIYASDSFGGSMTRADATGKSPFDMIDAHLSVAEASAITAKGIITDLDKLVDKIDDTALGGINGAEYAKNYILLAGILSSADNANLFGSQLDNYVRNRFNTEALAGTEIGKIGLTDSQLGRFVFMYQGFPIRDLTLTYHNLIGGGLSGDLRGSLEYVIKWLGAKGAVWAMEAPWGYSLNNMLGLDPFGLSDGYDNIPGQDYEDKDKFFRALDYGMQYAPFMQGAMTSMVSDIYFTFRNAKEDAKEKWLEDHDSLDGFEWSAAEASQQALEDLVSGMVPASTAASRLTKELESLDRGYAISSTGNRMFEADLNPGNIAFGLVAGRNNTAAGQEYFQTSNPFASINRSGIAGLGQALERANPFRRFREFDPVDTETYSDWFDGSYADEQNWLTGIYDFRNEAQDIRDKYDRESSDPVANIAARENELADFRTRLEQYVQAYTEKHPEGISSKKMKEIQRVFRFADESANKTFEQELTGYDYSPDERARNYVAAGNFPTAYGVTGPTTYSPDAETKYYVSPELYNALSEGKYGVSSDVPRALKMADNSRIQTPSGEMTLKEYREQLNALKSAEYDKANPDYDRIEEIQREYLKAFDAVFRPILETYGSSIINNNYSSGRSSDIMQELNRMLSGWIPSDDYRVDKYGKAIRQSTPYMTVDTRKWLQKNYSGYSAANTTDRKSAERLEDIRSDLDSGKTSTAKAKARALINDLDSGRVSMNRDELEFIRSLLEQ